VGLRRPGGVRGGAVCRSGPVPGWPGRGSVAPVRLASSSGAGALCDAAPPDGAGAVGGGGRCV